jgi:hypothetical protein
MDNININSDGIMRSEMYYSGNSNAISDISSVYAVGPLYGGSGGAGFLGTSHSGTYHASTRA